jgi:hypothetical protein
MESKKLPAQLVVPAEVQELCRRIEQWRQTRRRREPMPELLWESAVRLSREFGIARIARFTHVDYYSLKKRFDPLDRSGVRAAKRPAFVEVTLPSYASASECIIEFEQSRGDRMRIHVKGGPAPDLAAISRSFWSRE